MKNFENCMIFDPFQLPIYGGQIFEGDGFSYRYYNSKKVFWNKTYIPFGPVCDDEKGFENFINHIEKSKLTRFTIDLPLLIDKKVSEFVLKKLESVGFKKIDYIHERETILITKDNYNPEEKEVRYYVRKGLKTHDVKVFDKIDDEQLNALYNSYVESGKRIGYEPKSKEIIKSLCERSICSLAYNKETGQVEGFVLGHISNLPVQGYINADRTNVMQILYIGTNDNARKTHIGYALHKILFDEAFEKFGVGIIDFRGADRSRGEVYINFKKAFGGEFIPLQGPYRKDYLL